MTPRKKGRRSGLPRPKASKPMPESPLAASIRVAREQEDIENRQRDDEERRRRAPEDLRRRLQACVQFARPGANWIEKGESVALQGERMMASPKAICANEDFCQRWVRRCWLPSLDLAIGVLGIGEIEALEPPARQVAVTRKAIDLSKAWFLRLLRAEDREIEAEHVIAEMCEARTALGPDRFRLSAFFEVLLQLAERKASQPSVGIPPAANAEPPPARAEQTTLVHPVERILAGDPHATDRGTRALRALREAAGKPLYAQRLRELDLTKATDDVEACRSVYNAISKRFRTAVDIIEFRAARPPSLRLLPRPKSAKAPSSVANEPPHKSD